MIIGLDFDGTVTADHELFFEFVKLAKRRGHQVYIVTMRFPTEDLCLPQDWKDLIEGVVFTSRQAKEPVFRAAYGCKPHIWIDDNPRAVNESAVQVFGWSSKEGQVIDPKQGD